jgi:hypothetical protein
MEALERELREAKALRWTDPVRKDVPPPAAGSTTSGFVFNAHNGSVSPAWSKSVAHGIGSHAPQSQCSGSQNGISMFSSRLLALRALRHEVERESAKRLAAIDKEIEAELQKEAQ